MWWRWKRAALVPMASALTILLLRGMGPARSGRLLRLAARRAMQASLWEEGMDGSFLLDHYVRNATELHNATLVHAHHVCLRGGEPGFVVPHLHSVMQNFGPLWPRFQVRYQVPGTR